MITNKASYDDIETAFLAVSGETEAWFDRVTGEMILVNDDLRYAFRQIPSMLPDEEREAVARISQVWHAVGLWDEEYLGEFEGEAHTADRYVAIPETPSYIAFQDMTDFIAELQDTQVAAVLTQALRGSKAFRHFKKTLCDYPAEQTAWYKFFDQRLRERITTWANEAGITLG